VKALVRLSWKAVSFHAGLYFASLFAIPTLHQSAPFESGKSPSAYNVCSVYKSGSIFGHVFFYSYFILQIKVMPSSLDAIVIQTRFYVIENVRWRSKWQISLDNPSTSETKFSVELIGIKPSFYNSPIIIIYAERTTLLKYLKVYSKNLCSIIYYVWACYVIILMIQTKLFSNLYLAKFLDILANPLFHVTIIIIFPIH